MIRGVVFDLDGTLLDTEKLYRRFWVEAARRMGYPMDSLDGGGYGRTAA